METQSNVQETKEKKNMTWSYNTVNKILTATFPSGTTRSFNLSARVNGMAMSDELIFQYGIRQWLSSNAASLKDEKEKIERFMSDFEGFTEKGLVLSEGGTVISIVGKERSNGTGNAENKAIVLQVKNIRKEMDPEKLKALKTLGFQLSADEQKALDEYEAGK